MAWRIGEVTVIGEVEELGAPPAYGASKVTLVCNGAKACSKGSATCADAPIGTAGATWGTIVAAVMAALMCPGSDRSSDRSAPPLDLRTLSAYPVNPAVRVTYHRPRRKG